MLRRKTLKCLSLKQPYAELVAAGRKTIERQEHGIQISEGNSLFMHQRPLTKRVVTY